MTSEEIVAAVPGERLGSLEQYLPGKGTYIRHGYVYSSLVGFKHVDEKENEVVTRLSTCTRFLADSQCLLFLVVFKFRFIASYVNFKSRWHAC